MNIKELLSGLFICLILYEIAVNAWSNFSKRYVIYGEYILEREKIK
jgi:hypothetical protein